MPTEPQTPMSIGGAAALIVSSLIAMGGFIKAYRDAWKKNEAKTVSVKSFRLLAKRVTAIEDWKKSLTSTKE